MSIYNIGTAVIGIVLFVILTIMRWWFGYHLLLGSVVLPSQ